MNFDDWRPIKRNTARFLHDLEAFVEEFIPWEIRAGHEPVAILSPAAHEYLARQAAERMAQRMVTGVAVTNARSWREAARKSLKGRRVFEGLKTEMASPVGARVEELIAENAKAILSLPEDLAARAARYIAREQRKGLRSESIVEALRKKMPDAAKSRIRMLARTQVAAAETALTQARAENLGLHWYEWATSEDARVRPGHRLLDKVLVAWTDPPAPEQLAHEPSKLGHYHPGGAPNCRCISLPLISLDEVRWPHKIYEHGKIEVMTRREFERWTGLPQAA